VIDEIGRQGLAAMVTLVLILGPAFTAIWFLQRRKRTARQLRRSPLTTELLRSPGQTLRDKMEDMRIDVAMETVLLMVVPMFPLAYLQIHSLISGRSVPLGVVVAVAVPTAAFVVFQIRKLLVTSKAMDKLRLGFDAEVAVGQELDQLMRDGAVVFHDMPAERFNIDHVVIACQGVFAVETKGYTKPNRDGGSEDATVVYDGKTLALPERSGSWAIEQALRQAKWLAGWLTGATGEPIHVTPVVAMPGWFVDRKGHGEVMVFSGKELRIHLLKARSARPLTMEQMQRVVHQIERQCRNVAPSYRPEEADRGVH
jgi:Nuclease-related domain